MSNTQKNVGLADVVKTLEATMSNGGFATKSQGQVRKISMGLESLSDADRGSLEDVRSDFRGQIKNALEGLGLENMGFQANSKLENHLRDNALAAAAYVAMAAGDPAAFARHALESRFEGNANAPLVTPNTVFGLNGQSDLDYRNESGWSLEAYDNKNLTDFLPYSIAFNIYGQRQDEFSELLFKTFVVPPEQAGIEVTASRLLVYRDQAHGNQAVYNMNKRNLISAAVDYTILKDESTRLIPYSDPSHANDAMLIDSTIVGDSFLQVAGVTVPTRPLKIGVPVNLLAVSQYQPLVGAGVQFDNQDAVDSAIRLETLAVSQGAGKPGIVFDVSRFPGNQFQRSLSGNYREMNLNFETNGLVIDANTKAVDGTAIASLAVVATGNYTVFVHVGVNGKFNTEKGNGSLTSTTLSVYAIYDVNGNAVALNAGDGATIVAAVAALSVAGYTLLTNRTNSNRRTRGLRIDTTLVRERYYIPLGAPLSVARPNDPWQQQSATDLKAIVTAARIRNSNNAVTAMFNIIDSLKANASNPALVGEDDSAAIGGLGRLLIKPFIKELTVNLPDLINSTSSAQKAEDVAGVLVNLIRDVSFTMLRETNYQPALEAQVGGPAAKPTLFVGTDQRLIRHLMVTGDDRTFTPMFDTAIVKESVDARMHDKIVLTFVRPDATEPDLLSFGAHIWSTELVSTLQVTRSGESNSIETMVQPRTLHINMMPVIAVITVNGLEQVLETAAQYHITPTVVVSP